MNKLKSNRIDWMITLAPFILIMALAGVLFIFPEQSNDIIGQVRFFFGDTLGIYYLVIGLGVLLVSVFFSFSKYGDVVLGEPNEKPKYSFFAWGSMMFTCGLAADILFYSFALYNCIAVKYSVNSKCLFKSSSFKTFIAPLSSVGNVSIPTFANAGPHLPK